MSDLSLKHVAVVGGGPAGLMAADVVSAAGVRVTVLDRMPSLGRKLLMAGRGGLNLTHSEPLAVFLNRYGEGAHQIAAAIEAFTPAQLIGWAEALGQPTFVGSSGRVFPNAMKTSPLLRAWLRQLAGRGVEVRTRHRFAGWTEDGALRLETPDGMGSLAADAVVLALGGASWPGLGSDAAWVPILREAGIDVTPLAATNCGFRVAWSTTMLERFEGEAVKRLALSFEGETQRGEIVVTAGGIEGGAIYALSRLLRERIGRDGFAEISIDLRPDLDAEALTVVLSRPRRKQSLSTFLRKTAHLPPVAIGLLQEAAHAAGLPLPTLDGPALAASIKDVRVRLDGLAPIDRAISSAGGVVLDEIDAAFMLKRRPGVFVAGEMLDWDAPTGGYLLQACFATGAAAGRGVVSWLKAQTG